METAAPPARDECLLLDNQVRRPRRRPARRDGAPPRPRGRAPGAAARSLAVAPRDGPRLLRRAERERREWPPRPRRGPSGPPRRARGRREATAAKLPPPCRENPRRAPPRPGAAYLTRLPFPLADRDDDPNYNAYVIQAAAFFMIAALGLVWTVCACYECKKFTDCCCPNPECGPCACVECLPGFRPGASGDSKKTDGAGAVEMTEEV